AQQITQWSYTLEQHWSKLRFGHVYHETVGDFHRFRAQVYLDELEPASVLVELYAQAQNGGAPGRQPLTRRDTLIGTVKGFLYTAEVPSTRNADDYTPRIVPAFRDVHVPLEARQILWQH